MPCRPWCYFLGNYLLNKPLIYRISTVYLPYIYRVSTVYLPYIYRVSTVFVP